MPSGNSQQQQHDSTTKSILTKAGYRNLELTKRDVLGALNQYRGLKPLMQKFTFNDGRQRDLLVLDGTIPVNYKGNTYNIPVAVWPLDTHPNHAPLCYVKPTPDMQIKVSHSVDSNGRVYLPYLHEWSAHSDILTLIQMMIITFSEQPPVFARQQGQQQQQPQRPPQPQQPYPIGPAYGGSQRPPSYPMPYPPAGGAGQGMPPYPTQPSQGTPYPPGGPAGGGAAQQPPYPPMGAVPYGGGGGGGYPPPYATVQSQQQSNNGPGDSGTITQEMLKMSLLSAVEDKIKKELADDFNTKQAEIQNLKKIEEDLNAGRIQLQATLQKLDTESQELEGLCSAMSGETTSLETALERLESVENDAEEAIDDKIVTVTPLFKQVVACYSEDLALQDAIYYLSEALRKGVLDCDSFLKKVRELSRKQFYVRATLQKAREKAGLTV